MLGALSVPALAPASTTTTYVGAVPGDENAVVQLQVKRKHHRLTIRDGAGWTALDVACENEKQAELDTTFNFDAKVRKDGRFKLDASDEDSSIYLKGALGKGGVAQGTLRLDDLVDLGRGDVRKCDSGVEKWSAKRK